MNSQRIPGQLLQRPSAGRSRLPRGPSFWITTVLLFAIVASAGAPAPLYQVYQGKWGFSNITLTFVFVVYVVTLLITLLTVGSLSDYIGRRPVMFAALILAAIAAALFLTASGVGSLYAARAVQGIATGVASGFFAAMLDLRSEGNAAPLISSLAPTAGLAIGALGTSALVQYGPGRTKLIWWILLAIFIVGALLVLLMPEPGKRRPGALESLTPRLRVPEAARSAFLLAAPCLIGLWALGGFYLSLGPSLVGELEHSTNLLWGGVSIFLLMGLGAVASVAAGSQNPRSLMTAGCAGLLVGTGVSVIAIATKTPTVLLVGTAIAGLGFGPAFSGAYTMVVGSASEEERAELISAVYLLSYAALGAPAVLAGIAANHYGLRHTGLVYAAAVAVLAGLVLLRLLAGAKAAQGASPPASPVAPPPGPCTIPPNLPTTTRQPVEKLTSR